MRRKTTRDQVTIRGRVEAVFYAGPRFSAGKIDEALARLAAAQGQYAEWDELDHARVDIEGVIRDREGGGATSNTCSPPGQTNTPHNRLTPAMVVAPRNRPCSSHLAVWYILADLVGTVLGAELRSRLP